ncbi:hypothetical protein SAMN04490181_2649 [Pseudomonas brenneri]|uniref:Uncharacterized protein n=1 Tax=Pseudomonas brenneri TaxID=129817 RepID=A0ABY0WD54_9PSED|nr:hypothetical protein SAMN04490181_2649 [Pseudomonas brenneri]
MEIQINERTLMRKTRPLPQLIDATPLAIPLSPPIIIYNAITINYIHACVRLTIKNLLNGAITIKHVTGIHKDNPTTATKLNPFIHRIINTSIRSTYKLQISGIFVYNI